MKKLNLSSFVFTNIFKISSAIGRQQTLQALTHQRSYLLPLLFSSLLLSSGFIVSCDSSGGGESEPVALGVSLTEFPKGTVELDTGVTIDSVRDRWMFVTLTADTSGTGYLVGVKASSEAAPTAAEMTTTDQNVKKYNVSTSPINVILATKMGSTMFEYFDDNTDESGVYVDKDYALTEDILATHNGSDDFFKDSMLTPGTEYTIYGMESDGSSVTALGTITTDALNNTSVAPAGLPFSAPEITNTSSSTTTDYNTTLTLHSENYEIIPWQFFPPDYNSSLLGYLGRPGTKNVMPYINSFRVIDNTPFNSTETREQFFVVSDSATTSHVPVSRGLFLLLKGGGDFLFSDEFQSTSSDPTKIGYHDFSFSGDIQQ